MSIGTIFTSIGTFLTSPVISGMANVASIATLPVSIATKVDTDKMRKSISSMRAEMRYNVAYTGQLPVSVNHGKVALATEYAPIAGQIAAQKQNMYAAPQVQQESPAQSAQPQVPTPQVQQPTPQGAPVQNVMVGGQHDMTEMLKSMLPDIISGVVTALNQQAAPAQPETPQPPAQPAPDQKDDKKQNKNG